MAEVKPLSTEKTEDMTPVPTQAEIDKLMGETDEQKKKRDDDTAKRREATAKEAPPEQLVPTPTQEENDEIKMKAYGLNAEEAKKRSKEERGKVGEDGRDARGIGEPPEELQPTPTQFENDLIKTAAMNMGSLPEGGGDPQKKQKKLESGPGSAYQVRTMSPAQPATPATPAQPGQPGQPATPATPAQPAQPVPPAPQKPAP